MSTPTQLAAEVENWRVRYSRRSRMMRNRIGATIPALPGSLNVLFCRQPVIIGNRDRITLNLTVHCDDDTDFTRPDLSTNIGTAPESARVCIIRNMRGQFARWWGVPGIKLTRGQFGLVLDLDDPAQWVSVYGKAPNFSEASRKGFQQRRSEMVNLAVVFGGGNFYGHGASVQPGQSTWVEINSLRIV